MRPALPLGSARYPIPAGAYFVSPNGSDAHSGKIGAPFRTLARAAAVAPSGSTIVLRRGRYHESIQVRSKRLTLQNYPGEAAVMKGSVPVGGWVRDGSTWRHDGWTAEFPNGGYPEFIDPKHPLATYADQVFVSGRELVQVASKAAVKLGSFYVDDANNRLYIGSNPTGHLVEASDLRDALFLNAANGSIVRGLGFQQYATTRDLLGAVKGYASSLRFENDVFSQNAFAGLSIIGDNITVLNNTMNENGQLGLHGHDSNVVLVRGNVMNHNNREHMKLDSAEGGVKFTESRNVLLDHNLADANYGRGFWFDEGSSNLRLVHNTARNNTDRGLEVEISGPAIVAANYVYDNGGYGIYVVESHDVKVYNNTAVRNYHDIFVLEGSRPQNVSNVRIVNNAMAGVANHGNFVFGIDDSTHKRSAKAMGVSDDANAFYRPSAGAPSWLVASSNWPTQMRVFTTLSSFKAYSGMEAHGLSVDAASDPFFVNSAADNFALRSGSPLSKRGLPLPSDIAAAIGVQAGVPVDIGAIG